MQRVLDIYWSLLPSPWPAWKFHSTSGIGYEVISDRVKLLKIADRIAAHPDTLKTVNFTGYSPVCHPYFLDIVSHLQKSAPEIPIVIDCDANEDRVFYERLFRACNPAMLSFNIYVAHMDKSLVKLSPLLSELQRSRVSFRIMLDDGGLEANPGMKLADLRKRFPFEFDLEPRSPLAAIDKGVADTEAHPLAAQFFCLGSSAFVGINSAGEIYAAPCSSECLPGKAWEGPKSFTPLVVRCRHRACSMAAHWNIPRFETLAQVAEWQRSAVAAVKYFSSDAEGDIPISEPSGLPGQGSPAPPVQRLNVIFEAIGNVKYADKARSIYAQLRPVLHEELARAHRHNVWDVVASKRALLKIASSVEALRLLIEDYASLFPGRELSSGAFQSVPVCPGDLKLPAFSPVPYPGAEGPYADSPLLSVIVSNSDSGGRLSGCLDELFAQSLPSYEILAITAQDAELLEKCNRQYPCIRLWHVDKVPPPGVGRNFLLDKARGRYVLFVDASDLYAPAYFETALRIIGKARADVAVFAHNGAHPKREERIIDSHASLQSFFSMEISPAIQNKIFDLDLIRAYGVRFKEDLACQDYLFVYRILTLAHRIALSGFVPSESPQTGYVTGFPEEISHDILQSSYGFMDFYQQAANDFFGEHEAWSHMLPIKEVLWRVLVPNASHLRDSAGNVPISASDHEKLRKATLFLRCLLEDFGRLCAQK